MAHSKIIPFDRPLASAVLPGHGKMFSEAEVATKMQQAYRQGVDATHAATDQKLVEFRHDMEQLSDGVLRQLSELEPALLTQIRAALPALAVDIARRLLAEYEPPAEIVERLCRESLEQLFPERDGLELSLCARDAVLLETIAPAWLTRYPGLKITVDTTLARGDCLVRSRFGLTDARQATKLAALEQSLVSA